MWSRGRNRGEDETSSRLSRPPRIPIILASSALIILGSALGPLAARACLERVESIDD